MKYLYTHSINGIVFYVGCGTKDRPYDKHSRSKQWKNKVSLNDWVYNIEIISEFNDKEKALIEELKLIRILMPECNLLVAKRFYKKINSNMKAFNTQLPDDLKERLEKYSKESGLRLQKITEFALNEYIKRHPVKK